MSQPLITPNELQGDRIEEGDAVFVLKKDGSFRIMNCHASQNLDPAALTERQFAQGKALAAFSFMLREPPILNMVAEMAMDQPSLELGKLH